MKDRIGDRVEGSATGQAVSEDYRLFVFIGLMLLFLTWLFHSLIFGWLFLPFAFYFFRKAYRTRKGMASFYCSACGAALEDPKVAKCPRCYADLK
ncbi:hypothetical protein EPN96_07645 [bacterium]|nr:MAG: hypothetical protein EPN96_07645 [bacterium]